MAETIVPDLSPERKANFWGKVAIGKADDCWPWIGSRDSRGYGRMGMRTNGYARPYLATHVSLTIHGRPRPTGMLALHSCDNPNCVNPAHLRWGTSADNAADKISRGRAVTPHNHAKRMQQVAARGGRHCRAKLTEQQVRAIIQDERLHREIAADYGIKRCYVGDIKAGKTWRHIHDELRLPSV